MSIEEAPASEVPQAQCPGCGAWVPDLDGFGVLAHLKPQDEDGCGYCVHPSMVGGVCDCCGTDTTQGEP